MICKWEISVVHSILIEIIRDENKNDAQFKVMKDQF